MITSVQSGASLILASADEGRFVISKMRFDYVPRLHLHLVLVQVSLGTPLTTVPTLFGSARK